MKCVISTLPIEEKMELFGNAVAETIQFGRDSPEIPSRPFSISGSIALPVGHGTRVHK